MKRNISKKIWIAIFAVIVVIAVVSIRALRADNIVPNTNKFASVSKYGEDISIYVNFGIDSSQKRFFVYDNRGQELISSTKCAHGCEGGSTSAKPVFSNKSGSNCSSLGIYKLTSNSRLANYNMPCIRIVGLSKTNSNAKARGIVIHEAPFVADDISVGMPIPVSPYISQGCIAISSKTFGLLQELISDGRSIYIYAVYEPE